MSTTNSTTANVCDDTMHYWNSSGAICIQFQEICCSKSIAVVVMGVSTGLYRWPRTDTAKQLAISKPHIHSEATVSGSLGVRNICDGTEDCLSGESCTRIGQVCCTMCGNAIINPYEECDDGNQTDGDECQGNCMNPKCGDGIVDSGEDCDDEVNVKGDGCLANSKRRPVKLNRMKEYESIGNAKEAKSCALARFCCRGSQTSCNAVVDL